MILLNCANNFQWFDKHSRRILYDDSQIIIYDSLRFCMDSLYGFAKDSQGFAMGSRWILKGLDLDSLGILKRFP